MLSRPADLDLRAYFDTVRHDIVLEKVAARVNDGDIMSLLKMIMKTTGKRGVPQGDVITPVSATCLIRQLKRSLSWLCGTPILVVQTSQHWD